MRQLTKKEVDHIARLNSQLVEVEKRIYTLAKEQNAIAQRHLEEKRNAIYDYELEVEISCYLKDYHEDAFVSWTENAKSWFTDRERWGVNDGNDHNVTSCCWKNAALNAQHHCWLLHHLYDNLLVPWEYIMLFDLVNFDIKTIYQYEQNINPLQ